MLAFPRLAYIIVSMCAISVMLVTTACAPRELLSHGLFEPAAISPNADGTADVARISYELGANATVSIYLESDAGTRFYFRKEQRRAAGSYSVLFGGVIEGRLLSDGTYRWTIEATPDSGERQSVDGSLILKNGELTAPEITSFSIFPKEFTPNRDGISDRTTINVDLANPANLQVSLQNILCNGSPFPPAENPDLDCTPYPLAHDERLGARAPGEEGLHEFDYDAGVDLGAEPPPDGLYVVSAHAEDAVGQVTIVTDTLSIIEGGIPRAEIAEGEILFSATSLLVGQTLYFTVTVENYGTVPIRTSGPSPGYIYEFDENFNVPRFAEESGAWRVGIDFDTSQRNYPFRWALASPQDLVVRTIDGQDFFYMLPNTRSTISGGIHITHVPPRSPLNFWAGLIHEDVEISSVNNRVDPHFITIDEP